MLTKLLPRLILLACTIIILAGCHDKMPVEVVSDQPADDLEVASLQLSIETSLSKSIVDTTGVLNTEQSKYRATMFLSGVKYDLGTTRQTVSYSSVTFSDKNLPVDVDGRELGFRGIDLGRVQLNGMDMIQSQRFIHLFDLPIFGDRDTAVGPAYVLANRNGKDAKNFNFLGNSRFEWDINARIPIDTFSISVQTPDEITIISPKSTSIISKNDDLHVQWTGKVESFRVIISGLRGSDIQPILQINLKKSDGNITIPAKILALLPTDTYQTFVFSFISSKTKEVQVSNFSDEIFVVASSIHDVVLTVQ
jgi:hypothetical protein